MYNLFQTFIKDKPRLCIIQAENPDGDSLGSAIALDYLLPNSENSLYCPVDVPGYLHYFDDWSRVTDEFDYKADGYIIVDTASTILLSKLLEDTAIRNCLYTKPVLVIDHHSTEDDLDFPHEIIVETRPACADVIFQIAKHDSIPVPEPAATALYAAIASDTLGLVSAAVTAETMYTMGDLIELGADPAKIEEHRREFMKKSQRILDYKADLIKRIEYSLDGTVATVHIPFEEIHAYSSEYNPNVLILEEMRLVEGVIVAVAIKTYPDGKITGKVRTSEPVAERIANFFGGGGHPYASGFRTYDVSYEEVVADIVRITPDLLAEARSAAETQDASA